MSGNATSNTEPGVLAMFGGNANFSQCSAANSPTSCLEQFSCSNMSMTMSVMSSCWATEADCQTPISESSCSDTSEGGRH